LARERGLLVAVEGITGAGKTTLIDLVRKSLPPDTLICGGYRREDHRSDPLHRDILEAIRRRLARDPFLRVDWRSETLLLLAELHLADRNHVRPALAEGRLVVYEHHLASIIAYQSARLLEDGHARSLKSALAATRRLVKHASDVSSPDVVLFVEAKVDIAVRRAARRDRRRVGPHDVAFERQVQAAYGAALKAERVGVRRCRGDGRIAEHAGPIVQWFKRQLEMQQ